MAVEWVLVIGIIIIILALGGFAGLLHIVYAGTRVTIEIMNVARVGGPLLFFILILGVLLVLISQGRLP